ncbi:MAG: glycosyltransferase family 4 protein [Parasporobacterium sp.]|nr:glycosyltransferase family 4 protein [Parasporobacterium sp.]
MKDRNRGINIWLMNHYATNTFVEKAGRHYWFAEHLEARGNRVTVFCANTNLNNNDIIDTGERKYTVDEVNHIVYVFVKTIPSQGNGIKRILNWFVFYKNLFPATKSYAKKYKKPDVIVASSVHPLTMVAGIQIAKRIGIPCINEVRDLWPEAIFSFGKAKEKSLLGRILLKGEHWIYRKADALIFTKEGDTDYLKEKRWTIVQGGDIDLAKCHYINNGVDLAACEERIKTMQIEDPDLIDASKFNVIYVGTIRPVNNVGNLVDVAKILKGRISYDDIQILIYGEGVQLEELKRRAEEEHLDNIKFKGYINRQYVPFILSRSSVNVLNYSQNQYNWSRGNSSNKLFEYMASGKPIISTVHMGYSIIKQYDCGVELDEDTPEALAKEIMRFHDMSPEERTRIGQNARKGVEDFDFGILTEKLLSIIESVVKC